MEIDPCVAVLACSQAGASLIPHTRSDYAVLAFSPWYQGRQGKFLYVSRRGTMRRIGVIGVGLLGSAVASRLLQRDFEVTGYDTRPEQLKGLDVLGLCAATSIAEAAAGADVVLTILPSLESVETVVSGPGGLVESAAPHTIVMQMSTISPALTQRLHQALVGTCGFLDTPISGTSAMVACGDCTLLVGGELSAVQ